MLNYAQGALCPGGPGKASLEGKESKLNPEVLARWTELEEYFTAQVEISFITVNIVWCWFSC